VRVVPWDKFKDCEAPLPSAGGAGGDSSVCARAREERHARRNEGATYYESPYRGFEKESDEIREAGDRGVGGSSLKSREEGGSFLGRGVWGVSWSRNNAFCLSARTLN